MKDYLLSEIKNHDWHEEWEVSNDITKGHFEYELLREFQYDLKYKDIEPRDMIELPCINEIDKSKTGCYTLDGKFYEVIFRDKDGSIKVEQAESKDEANKFLAMLKEN